jgi:hypothetical protein
VKVVRKEFYGVSRKDEFRVIPLGDVHVGSAQCNEKLLKAVVGRVKEEKNTYWIDMGDKCEFINLRDPRFAPDALASWIRVSDMMDLAKAQRDRYLEFIHPIAPKVLGMVEGNVISTLRSYRM